MSFAFDDNAYSGYKESNAEGGIKFILDTFEKYHNPKGNGNKAVFDGEKYLVTLYFKGNNAIPNDREDDSLLKKIIHEAKERGHEIGSHTFTHPEGFTVDWGKEPPVRKENLNAEDWHKELSDCIEILTKPYNENVVSGQNEFGMGLNREAITGFRTPYLAYNDAVFEALQQLNFKYDASIEEGWQTEQDGTNFLWPYTLDAGSPGDAFVANDNYSLSESFVKNHPGLWELPVYVLIIPPDELCEKYGTAKGARKRARDIEGEDSILEDGKITGVDWNIWFQYFMNKEDALATMKYTFDLRYNGNRCPFTFGMHTDIYSDNYDKNDLEGEEISKIKANAQQRRQTIIEFLDYISQKSDTRVTTAENIRQWLENPCEL